MNNTKFTINGKEVDQENFVSDYMNAIDKAVLNLLLNKIEQFQIEINAVNGQVELILNDGNFVYRLINIPEELKDRMFPK